MGKITKLSDKTNRKNSKLNNYYVPYDIDLVENMDTDIFLKNGQQQYAFKYTIPETNEKINLIFATGGMNKEPLEVLNHYLSNMKNSKENLSPEKYIAILKSKGCTITDEGMDIFINKQKEILRTVFTPEEQDNITNEQISDNKQRHLLAREKEINNWINEYLEKKYDEILESVTSKNTEKLGQLSKERLEEILKIRNEVIQYNKIVSNGKYELTIHSINSLKKWIDIIPDNIKDINEETIMKMYLERKETIKESNTVEQQEQANKNIKEFITAIDKNEEDKSKTHRKELMEKVNNIELNPNIIQLSEKRKPDEDRQAL